MYSHLFKKLEFSRLCRKKIRGFKNPEKLIQKSQPSKKISNFFLFPLQDDNNFILVFIF